MFTTHRAETTTKTYATYEAASKAALRAANAFDPEARIQAFICATPEGRFYPVLRYLSSDYRAAQSFARAGFTVIN
jgi:hypothetical protein